MATRPKKGEKPNPKRRMTFEEKAAQVPTFSTEKLRCMVFGHVWLETTTLDIYDEKGKFLHYEVVIKCASCGTGRLDPADINGHVDTNDRDYNYAKDYINKGFGRATGELKDVCRREWLSRQSHIRWQYGVDDTEDAS